MSTATNSTSGLGEHSNERFGCVDGLRVMDIGHMVAGPMAAGLLADHGADVIKVERPGHGDSIRRLGVHKEKGDAALWWKVVNRNKRTIALDFEQTNDRELLLRLVARTDVITTNFAPSVLASLDLEYERLRQVNPGLIMLSASGFGLTGPYRDRRGFGRTAEAFSGMAFTTGFQDGPPMHAGFPVADCMAALMGAFAVMAAIYERSSNSNHEGQHIDLALYEAPFRLMDLITVAFDQLGTVTSREGTFNSYVSPSGTWRSKDGKWASFTGSTQGMVERFFEGIGRPDLIDDPRFTTNSTRLKNLGDLDAIISEWMAQHTMAEVLAALERQDVAMSTYMTIEDIFQDPQYKACHDIIEIEDEEVGPIRMPAALPFFSRTPGRVMHSGRPMNADRNDILRDWLRVESNGGPRQPIGDPLEADSLLTPN